MIESWKADPCISGECTAVDESTGLCADCGVVNIRCRPPDSTGCTVCHLPMDPDTNLCPRNHRVYKWYHANPGALVVLK